jgi:hypothetical protein
MSSLRCLVMVWATLSLCAGVTGARAEGVTYRVTVDGIWTAASHPHEYPSDAHFSWLTGATHDEGYRLFEAGRHRDARPRGAGRAGRAQPVRRRDRGGNR